MDNPSAPPPSAPLVRRPHFIAGSALVVLLIAVGALVFVTPRRQTLPCGASMLALGESKFRIQPLTINSDQPPAVPQDKPGIAYWINGTSAHYVFGLSPSASTERLRQQLAAGDAIRITWADCSSEDFVVSSLSETIPGPAILLDQSRGGVSVFMPRAATSRALLIEGLRPELLSPQAAKPTDANAVQAEVSFLEQSISADGKTFSLKIAVKNTGSRAIHLTQDRVSLTPGNGVPTAPAGVDPALPADVQPGETQTFTIVFPKPAGNVATFKLLDFSVDLYY